MLTEIQRKPWAPHSHGQERRKTDTHGPQFPPPSSDPTARHLLHRSDRRLPKNTHIQDLDPDRPVNGSRNSPYPPSPRNIYQFPNQIPLQVNHRDAKELEAEARYDISPDTATNYPCTRKELESSGGANRQTAGNAVNFKDKTKWFAHPNKGPFLDSMIAAREIYDHNDPRRATSASGEDEAISRLVTGIQNARRGPWGPDLAIKAFCDLDKVFFCGRLRGHVCVTWQPDSFFGNDCYGSTEYLGAGKCVINLNPHTNFFGPLCDSGFGQMFATLLHEMW